MGYSPTYEEVDYRCPCGELAKARGMCMACYQRWWKEQNPQYHREYMQRWHARRRELNPPTCRECGALRRPTFRLCDSCREERKLEKRVAEYGLTLAEFRAMLAKQGGCCAICRKKGGEQLHIDHCHATGRVRGLLCPTCNLAVGKIDAAGLSRFASYLLG